MLVDQARSELATNGFKEALLVQAAGIEEVSPFLLG